MDVRLPDGTIISNVPDGISKADLNAKLAANGYDVSKLSDKNVSSEIDPNHAGAAQKERILALAKEGQSDPLLAIPIVGQTEAGINLASSLGSGVVGGITGLLDLAKSGIQNQVSKGLHVPTRDEFDTAVAHASDISQGIQQAGTYQPRTVGGKLGAEAYAIPAGIITEASRSLAGDVGQVVGGDQGRIIGEEGGAFLSQAVPLITGGAAVLRGRAVNPPTSALQSEVNMIRNASTEAPQSAVRPRYDASGQRIVYPEPAVPLVEPVPESSIPLYNLEKQTEGGNLPTETHTSRAAILQRIGLEQARKSAVEGDSVQGDIQAQIAKLTTEPAGIAAKDLFDTERNALVDHAQNIAANTGGSIGMDESTLNARGQIIAAPLDGLRRYFNDAIDKLYKAADERSDGAPSITLDKLNDMLSENHIFEGTAERNQIRTGINSYMKRFGLIDEDGNPLPITAQQAEGLRQYMNGEWQTKTSGLIGKLKDTIDSDVFSQAGDDIYNASRKLIQQKKATLDNPNGMAKITEFDTQTPINRTTAHEKIPDTLTRLPVAQFGHVIDTLNKILDPAYDTPPLLQLQAADALNEIRGHFANRLIENGSKFKGQWNSRGVTEYLKTNSAKLPMVFNNTELAKIADLNDAGHILSVDKSYPGSKAQSNIAVKHGLIPKVVSKVSAGTGALVGSVGGPLVAGAGAAAGAIAGDSIASSMGGKAALKNFNSGIVDLNQYKPSSVKIAQQRINEAKLNTMRINAANSTPVVAATAATSAGAQQTRLALAYAAIKQRQAEQDRVRAENIARLKIQTEKTEAQKIAAIGYAKTADEAISAAADAINTPPVSSANAMQIAMEKAKLEKMRRQRQSL